MTTQDEKDFEEWWTIKFPNIKHSYSCYFDDFDLEIIEDQCHQAWSAALEKERGK